eukprot:2716399-Karenia_brevis.AAC.1
MDPGPTLSRKGRRVTLGTSRTLMNFRCAARRARGAPANDNGKWQASSRYWNSFELRHAPDARRTWQ